MTLTRLLLIAHRHIADGSSILPTSTNLCRVARRSLGSDAAGPAPYGGDWFRRDVASAQEAIGRRLP